MNSIKKPETVITLINTAALLGASIYFYRKINVLEVELNKHSEHLTSTVKKVREIAGYKKHIADLGNAFKKLNNYLGIHDQDIQSLKDIVKHQNAQILEIQTLMKNEEIKLKENPFLAAILYSRQGFQGPNQQGFQGQQANQQGFQQGGFHQPNQGFQQGTLQPNQQSFQQGGFQQPNQQGFQQGGVPPSRQGMLGRAQLPPPQRESLIDLEQPALQSSQYQGFPPQQQAYFPQQQQQQQQTYFPQQQQSFFPPQQGYRQQPYSQFSESIDDEDAAIDAVRRARQQNNEDPLSGLF